MAVNVELEGRTTPQTPRRSKRHQPTVFASQPSLSQRRDDKWSSPPLHTRNTVSTDLIDDEESEVKIFSVGDTVLLATNVNRPSVGIIIALWEVSRPVTDSQMLAKRGHLPNEIYLSLDAASVVHTSSILTHCVVSSTRTTTPLSTTENTFFCANAVDSRRGLYYELDWRGHWEQSLERAKADSAECGSGAPWVVAVQPVVKRRRKVTEEDPDPAQGAHCDGEYKDGDSPASTPPRVHFPTTDDDAMATPRTPSKRRRRAASAASTPTTPRRKRVAPAALAAPTPHSNAPFAPMAGAFALGEASTEDGPVALPCRTEEYARVMRAVEELLEGGKRRMYLNGKTATVHAVVRELKRMAEQTYAISGHNLVDRRHLRLSAKAALKKLVGHACVVLMDELDQLMTAKQDVVYNFFNWPTLAGSKLVVLAVANTMDLPERVMSGRVRSRLGMVRINFQPYTTPQLEQIVHARLGGSTDVLSADAVKFAAMKVSSISGDARRVLDVCRRTVELVQPLGRAARTDDVKDVIRDLQNSPTAAFLRALALHERILLAALLKCVRRTGVDEIPWADVRHQHHLYAGVFADSAPAPRELEGVLDALLAARVVLSEARGARRIVFNLEPAEVERVLGEVGGQQWRNMLAA
ncbi:P-loop containing nucleoside triphosphate hydrolase protein [Lactarius hengduanensis]|nr:P-loop containing nucleoside triphosphate hydrolase protein [Lactarius hengduanensis]